MSDPAFLQRFVPLRRSLIANLFCYAVRNGRKDPAAVLEWVRQDVEDRLDRGPSPEQVDSLRTLLASLRTPDARAYAAFIIGREGMSPAERQREKTIRAMEHQRAYMDTQEPTEAQIGFLRVLGHTGPRPTSKGAASRLIEELKR